MIIGTAGMYLSEKILSKEEKEEMRLELKDKYTRELLKQFTDVEISFVEENKNEIVKVWVLDKGNKAYRTTLNVHLLEIYYQRYDRTILDAINTLTEMGELMSYIVTPEQLFVHNLIGRCDYEERLYISKFHNTLVVDDMKINLTKIDSIAFDNEDEEIFMIVDDIAYFINLDDITIHTEYYN